MDVDAMASCLESCPVVIVLFWLIFEKLPGELYILVGHICFGEPLLNLLSQSAASHVDSLRSKSNRYA